MRVLNLQQLALGKTRGNTEASSGCRAAAIYRSRGRAARWSAPVQPMRKTYRHVSSLSRHRRTCEGQPTSNGDELATLRIKAALFDEQREQVAELKALVEQVATQPIAATTNYVNINVILDNHCPAAINMSDFVRKLQLTIEDLCYAQENGYAQGLSQLFVKNLADMQPATRPIQCIDRSGELLYIREADRWGADADGTALGLQINEVRRKQLATLRAWARDCPEWRSSEEGTRTYLNLVQELTKDQEPSSRAQCIRYVERAVGRACRLEDVVDGRLLLPAPAPDPTKAAPSLKRVHLGKYLR